MGFRGQILTLGVIHHVLGTRIAGTDAVYQAWYSAGRRSTFL